MRIAPVDPDFPRLFGVKLLAGRLLDRNRGSDATPAPLTPDFSGGSFNVLINESAMKEFGFTLQNVVGKRVFLHNTEVTVVGVLADFSGGRARPSPGRAHGVLQRCRVQHRDFDWAAQRGFNGHARHD